ncbi:MAG: xanthine dehydrogenase family protein subunit M [Anaerolineaceae bacterium]|nr:xanthine dehydrogenase family protein subunit M [Anaerolineaceae bacterium]
MIPPPFEYTAPKTTSEAITLLRQDSDAKVLAGGQSLIPMMRFRLASPALLIDINRISGLEYIREEDGWLKIGALTREVDLDRSDLVRRKYDLLADTTRMVADPIVRNLATLGGNLAHADPANDHPATMLAYGARLVALGPEGQRVIGIDNFFMGPFESNLAHTEILTEIRIPARQSRSAGAYVKMERRVGDFATAAVAVQIQLNQEGVVSQAGIGLTNVGLMPIRAKTAEQFLIGSRLSEENIHHAAHLAGTDAQPQSDARGSEEYKRSLVRTLTVRALHKTIERLNGGS